MIFINVMTIQLRRVLYARRFREQHPEKFLTAEHSKQVCRLEDCGKEFISAVHHAKENPEILKALASLLEHTKGNQ